MKSVPEAVFSWDTVKDEMDWNGVPLELNRRVRVGIEGNLYILKVEQSDARDSRIYRCIYHNRITRNTSPSTMARIAVSGEEVQYPPKLMAVSDRKKVALPGETVKFQCIFGGNPVPDVKWTFPSKATHRKRFVEQSFGSILEIKKVRATDAGTYTCSVSSSLQRTPVSRSFSLVVDSKPKTATITGEGSLDGKAAMFECNSKGKPDIKISWFNNAKLITGPTSKLNARITGNVMNVTNIKSKDVFAIQCQAKNTHGAAISKAFILKSKTLRDQCLSSASREGYFGWSVILLIAFTAQVFNINI